MKLAKDRWMKENVSIYIKNVSGFLGSEWKDKKKWMNWRKLRNLNDEEWMMWRNKKSEWCWEKGKEIEVMVWDLHVGISSILDLLEDFFLVAFCATWED